MPRIDDKKDIMGTGFRKIDVDEFSENNFEEDADGGTGPTGPDENEILSLLNQYPFYKLNNKLNFFSYCSTTLFVNSKKKFLN